MKRINKRKIWVISDTHFQHDNILTFKDYNGNPVRPGFLDSAEMDDIMIQNWNANVKPGDIVYHLGDVTLGDRGKFPSIIAKLTGRKRLIVGNHDDIPYLSKGGWFQKVQMWRMMPEFGLLFSHVPLHKDSLYRRDSMMKNVHGHIHNNIVKDEFGNPDKQYINVCVEKTGYAPVDIESLID